jgi:hypothetical protein
VLVAFLMAGDVVRGFGLKGHREHPPGSLAGDLIQPGRCVLVAASDLDQVGHAAESSVREILRTDAGSYRFGSGTDR